MTLLEVIRAFVAFVSCTLGPQDAVAWAAGLAVRAVDDALEEVTP